MLTRYFFGKPKSGLNGILEAYPNILSTFNIDVDFDTIDSKDLRLSKNLRLYISFKEKCVALIDKITTGIKEHDVNNEIQLLFLS